MEGRKVTESELKVIERRLCKLERLVEVLLDQGDILVRQYELEEWYWQYGAFAQQLWVLTSNVGSVIQITTILY